jgi:hypothetical protein
MKTERAQPPTPPEGYEIYTGSKWRTWDEMDYQRTIQIDLMGNDTK